MKRPGLRRTGPSGPDRLRPQSLPPFLQIRHEKKGQKSRFGWPLCGLTVIGLGFIVMVWAWWLFRKRETAICHTAKSTALVAGGPFRGTRNPIVLGDGYNAAGQCVGFGLSNRKTSGEADFVVAVQFGSRADAGRSSPRHSTKTLEWRNPCARGTYVYKGWVESRSELHRSIVTIGDKGVEERTGLIVV
jgi:hypothetical protein